MFVAFDKVFHPEKKWLDKKITDMRPCNSCEVYEDYNIRAIYGSIAERQYVERPEECRSCLKYIFWQADCLAKLSWYENNDERLKGND